MTMTGKQAICIDCGEKYLSFASAKRCMECRDERMTAQSIERKRLKRIRDKISKERKT